jgi:hypothetical protein
VAARTVYTGKNSRLDAPVQCVVRTPAEWAELRSAAALLELPELEQVRFDREVVLVVGLGRRPTTAYSIQIDTVAASGGATIAVVRAYAPARVAPAGAAITAPVFAVAVPAPADSVVFVMRSRT